ncbi:MAG: tRNA 2-thiouridine(34) synthase MnmA [Capsulimonadaceae bacterium]|nr:tRNA 2-thiouridine(34) synthase MnmA [Capsulimonadaceae bacterium]
MASKATVVVAMSGGVDSSVAAALLKDDGYDVIGVTMQIWQDSPDQTKGAGCCSLGAVEDARRVAARIGIPHYCLNYRDFFAEKVIDDFVEEYRRGRTPNPCINCNRYVKFDALLSQARQLGADYLATGHYARIAYDDKRGRWQLRCARDASKDQTYALSYFTQEQLSRTLMPLGDLRDKAQTRAIAARYGLAVADKPDSQEICFTHGQSYTRFLARVAPETVSPGEVVDTSGKVLGHHDGIAFYTIGQRKRINVGSSVPLFVVQIDAAENRVTVGSDDELKASELTADGINWVSDDDADRVMAKIRYNMPAAPAVARLDDGVLRVRFDQPQRAITPGQAVVLYEDDIVLAGATIRCAVAEEACDRVQKTCQPSPVHACA